MQLTDEEQAMLDGAEGPAVAQAMSLLTRYGRALGAERLVSTNNVCGGSVGSLPGRRKVIASDADMSEIFSLLNLDSDVPLEIPKVKTMAYKLIEAGDPDYYDIQGVAPETQALVQKNADFCDKVGIQRCNTCTPYQVGNVPVFGEHCAWMESSAVVYANSVLGARTNVEGAQSAAGAMLTGRIPYWGYHTPEGRHATWQVDVTHSPRNMMEWGLLGYFIGERVQEDSPVLVGDFPQADLKQLKHFGAASATSGGVEMYHIVGRTPEAPTLEAALGSKKPKESFAVGLDELRTAYERLNCAESDTLDFVMLGCPHSSVEQVRLVAGLLEGRRIADHTQVWIFTPRALKAHADRMGYTKIIEDAGALLMTDSCPALSRVRPEGIGTVATDSCKQAHYLPATLGLGTHYSCVEDCIESAVAGRWVGSFENAMTAARI